MSTELAQRVHSRSVSTELVADGAITRKRADAYLADQDVCAAEGRFLGSTARYLVNATKPGG